MIMICGIGGMIGFLIGIMMYASLSGGPIQETSSELALFVPFVTTLIGGMIGYIIQALCDRVSKSNSKNKFAVLLVFTTLVFVFFFCNLLANWEHSPIVRDGRFYLDDLPTAFIHHLMLLSAAVENNDVLFIASCVFTAIYAIVILIIFFYSGKGSKASEHEGKYKVTVDLNTGDEVGERKMLDPATEALKKNIIIAIVFLIACAFFPLMSFAYGYCLCFENRINKDHTKWKPVVFTTAFTLCLYIVLFVVTAILHP